MKSLLPFVLSSLLLSSFAVAAEPSLHFSTHSTFAIGSSDLNEALVANHAHDPNDEFTVQTIELAIAARYNDYLAVNASYIFFLDDVDRIDGEWEDAYLSIDALPAGLSIKAGRLFNETTAENNRHLHAWKYANSSLLTSRFNGEEGLLSESIQLNWALPGMDQTSISLSYGDSVEYSHEEEAGALPTEVHGEESYLNTDIWTVSFDGRFLKDDFNQFFYRLHHSQGTNGYGLDGELSGLSIRYLWRENGQQSGGRYFEIGAEYAQRDYDYSSEDNSVTGNETEDGFALHTQYGFNEHWELGLRYETVNGSTTVEETPEIERFSTALTRRFQINDRNNGLVRLQYDHDNRSNQESANTVWLQFQFSFGSNL